MRPIIIAFISMLICSCVSTNKTSSFAKNVVVAHRGAWKAQNHPENSIAALKHAIALQCTGAEFDVQMTSDDILVVNHDDIFNGMSIAETTVRRPSRSYTFQRRKTAHLKRIRPCRAGK